MSSIFTVSRLFLHIDEWDIHVTHCDVSRYIVTIKACRRNIRKDFRAIKDLRGLREARASFRHAIALEKFTKKQLEKGRDAKWYTIWNTCWDYGRKDPILKNSQ